MIVRAGDVLMGCVAPCRNTLLELVGVGRAVKCADMAVEGIEQVGGVQSPFYPAFPDRIPCGTKPCEQRLVSPGMRVQAGIVLIAEFLLLIGKVRNAKVDDDIHELCQRLGGRTGQHGSIERLQRVLESRNARAISADVTASQSVSALMILAWSMDNLLS